MIKAGSLLYAVFVCFLVAVLCGAFVLIANVQTQYVAMTGSQEHLVDRSNSAFKIALGKFDLLSEGNNAIYFDDFNHTAIKKRWGAFYVLISEAYFKNDTIRTAGIVGKENKTNRQALYLTDLGKPLNMVGNAKIIGDVKTSKYGVKRAYINNQNFSSGKLVEGNISIADKRLPRLQATPSIESIESIQATTFSELGEFEKLVRPFHKETLIIELSPEDDLGNIMLRGNIVLRSISPIIIGGDAILNDIQVQAPSVTFETGFRGNVQVTATQEVILEEQVVLEYPSSISLTAEDGEQAKVVLEKESMLLGGIVLETSMVNTDNTLVQIDEDAQVVGDVYAEGRVQLTGKVTGSVHAQSFYLETKSSKYINYILDGEINATDLPENFVRLPLFENTTQRYAVVKSI